MNAGHEGRAIYLLALAGLFAVMCAIHLFYAGMDFADHYSYLEYLDRVAYFDDRASLLLEPASKLALMMLKTLTGSTDAAIDAAHYMIGLAFLGGMILIFPPREANWRGMLVTFAIFAPQLAFVTIRATPAYMLVAWGTLLVLRGERKGFWISALGLLFHVSTAIALPPILILLFSGRSTKLHWIQRPRNLALSAIAIFTIVLFSGSTVLGYAKSLFQFIPYLGKYLTFIQEAGSERDLSNLAVGHFIYLGALTIFTGLFMLINDPKVRRAGIFVLTSYAVYVFIFFSASPIAAFRQTPFWMIPALAIFPWTRVGWKSVAGPVFMLGTIGIFLFQFTRVLAIAL